MSRLPTWFVKLKEKKKEINYIYARYKNLTE